MSYIAVILVLSLMILIHEAGHFLAARAAGITIKIFSIGFGPALWKKSIGGTEFRVSMIPIGGYVLPDVADEQEFFAISPGKRIIFSLGGPAGNIAAAIVILGIINTLNQGFSVAGTLTAPLAAAGSFFIHFCEALPAIFSKPDNLSGVVGIVSQGSAYIGGSGMKLLGFTAIMNLNLAVFNLLPLPVLDGGKIILYLLEKVHPKLVKLHVPLSVLSWGMIILLTVYVTVIDIIKLA